MALIFVSAIIIVTSTGRSCKGGVLKINAVGGGCLAGMAKPCLTPSTSLHTPR